VNAPFLGVLLAASLILPGFLACASAHPAPRAAAAPAPDELGDGIELYQQGKYAEAEAPAKAALEANGTHEIAVSALGASLVGQGKFDEAVARLSAAVAARADLAYAYYWRAQAFQQQKKADRMVADYETFLKLAPKAPEAATIQQFLSTLQ
jgi:tetratricopeptide (TPR) repeat protein